MLGLVVDDSLPLLLPQLEIDGTHNEAQPLELDTIGPYQITRLELYVTDWKPFVRDAKSALAHLGGGTSNYSHLLPNYAGCEDVPIIPTIMLA